MGLIEINAAIDAICDEFSEVYCNNCDHKSDDGDYCEDCHRKYMNWAASRETVERVLNALPSAQQEPKTAHWIPLDERFPWSDYFKCSECGFRIKWENVTDFGGQSVDYCPHCGAKMEVENG